MSEAARLAERQTKRAPLDLGNPEVFAEGRAHQIFQQLRANDPVHWNPGDAAVKGWWDITRYDDVLAISRDTTTFSSAAGVMLPEPRDPALALKAAGGGGKMIIRSDPPRHTDLRKILMLGFTRNAVAELEPRTRRITQDLLAAFLKKGDAEFVTEVSSRLPLAVICELMGVAREDWPLMFDLTNKILGSSDPVYQTDIPPEQRGTPDAARMTSDIGTTQMFAFFGDILKSRRASGGTDLVSVVAQAKVDGDQLSDEDILWFCFLLVIAGNETTRNSISGGLLALLEYPDQFARLRADPTLLPAATEEMLRWVSPVAHMCRTATRDMELHGRTITKGERVVLWYPSANFDDSQFPDPRKFDLSRFPNRHFAFGVGIHTCLGANLARLEMNVFFEELLRTTTEIAVDGPVRRLRSIFLNGITSMPIRAKAA